MNQIMDPDDLTRATTRIAHEIVERNQGVDDIVVLGIPTRGRPFADRIATALSEIAGRPIVAGSLDIGMYRDDIDTRPKTRIGPTEIPEPIDGKVVVLVDDVLFTGRTVRAALDAVTDFGRPRSIQLAVMVDRGHRELPIRPDYIGKNLPTGRDEMVRVSLESVELGSRVPLDEGTGTGDQT